MDYLVNEGYPAAARRFAAEANIQPPSDAAETIEERVDIRNSILAGHMQEAIEKINDLDPEVSSRTDVNRSLQSLVTKPCNDYTRLDHAPHIALGQ